MKFSPKVIKAGILGALIGSFCVYVYEWSLIPYEEETKKVDVATQTPEPTVTPNTEPVVKEAVPSDAALPTFTTETLLKYNGTDPALPIYIAYEGNVYDVTPGKEYYEKGGAYDFLSGTDGTDLLHMVGGDIIKRKYKVIGTFTP